MNVVRPAPWSEFTTPEFWNDSHISAHMLKHHLDPQSDRASRPHAFIDESVEWMTVALHLHEGDRLLDLGCGPGLYSIRLARLGIDVTGIDASERSVTFARDSAKAEGLSARFLHGNYLEADLSADYDVAILIFEDYCALSPSQRVLLLRRVHDALRPGGRLLFDVTNAARFSEFADFRAEGTNLMNGFWAPPPYHGVHERWTYPEFRLILDKYEITTSNSTKEFWNWMQCLTPEEVRSELQSAGFTAREIYGDVAGAPYDSAGPSFAVIASHSSVTRPSE